MCNGMLESTSKALGLPTSADKQSISLLLFLTVLSTGQGSGKRSLIFSKRLSHTASFLLSIHYSCFYPAKIQLPSLSLIMLDVHCSLWSIVTSELGLFEQTAGPHLPHAILRCQVPTFSPSHSWLVKNAGCGWGLEAVARDPLLPCANSAPTVFMTHWYYISIRNTF